MGFTLAEKILAAHSGQDEVRAGDFVEARVDVVLSNDITAPIAIREFEKLGVGQVFDPEAVVMVPDHFAPNKDIKSAEQCLLMRQFARKQELSNYFEIGQMGIEHVLLPEQGLVGPGDLVVGADPHTCTYGALGAFATGMGSTDIAVAMATGRIWMRAPETVRIVYTGQLQPWVDGKDLILYTIGKISVSGARYKAIEFVGPVMEQLSWTAVSPWLTWPSKPAVRQDSLRWLRPRWPTSTAGSSAVIKCMRPIPMLFTPRWWRLT